MKHYDTDTDLVVGAGVQAPWPGQLYNMPVVIHTHAQTGSLKRSYHAEQPIDGFGQHYDHVGSTDSFGMPLQGFGDMMSSWKTWAVVGVAAAAAYHLFLKKR